MSELDGNININDVLQIIRFGGDGLKFALKGVKTTGKGIVWLNNQRKMKTMKARLFLHYHSKAMSGSGKLKGMSLHSLEKLTGGSYGIINIPTEKKEELAKFFKVLKKAKIPYSVLPDLIPGNNCSQIAVDMSTSERINPILKAYDFDQGKIVKDGKVKEENKASFGTVEEYWDEGNKTEKEKVMDAAIKEAEKEQEQQKNIKNNPSKARKGMKGDELEKNVEKVISIEKIREQHNSKEYYPVTIDKKMIVAETDEAYITRIPGSYNYKYNDFSMLTVKKKDAIMTNDNQTILTHIKKDGDSYIRSYKSSKSVKISNRELYREHYSRFTTDFDRNSRHINRSKSNTEIINNLNRKVKK